MFKSELGVAVKEAEAVCEEHKLVLKEMFRIKMRVLEGWDVALDEFQMLREVREEGQTGGDLISCQTSKIRVDYEQTLQRYNHCKEETLESFEDSMYDESLLLVDAPSPPPPRFLLCHHCWRVLFVPPDLHSCSLSPRDPG
eukprot:764898-Hanusia_phi.AAC.19